MNDRTTTLRQQFRLFEADCGPIIHIKWNDGNDWSADAGRWGAYSGPMSACPHLDDEYDNGFGLQECPDFTIWSATHVGWCDEYDGATSTAWLPIHPPTLTEAIHD